MNKLILFANTFLLLILTACNQTQQPSGKQDAGARQAAAVYACPMKCEGDKTYDTAGQCPVCKMDLEPVANAAGMPPDSMPGEHPDHHEH
ncbi:MAG: hypothetical protein IPH12_19055 [Saprospirales bacterium]|nr:hypothetical protein [Saprospirales bacterium]MBK8920025.1 hypothetical protein [Saprospirales bacterium]